MGCNEVYFIALIYSSKMSLAIARAGLMATWGWHSEEYIRFFSDLFFFHQRAAVSVSTSVTASLKLKR